MALEIKHMLESIAKTKKDWKVDWKETSKADWKFDFDSATGNTYQAAAPANTVLPAITGTVAAGQVLTASTGTWTADPLPITYAYQWNLDGVAIVGATAATYTVAGGDSTKTLTCTVTATNNVGSTAATSAGSVVA